MTATASSSSPIGTPAAGGGWYLVGVIVLLVLLSYVDRAVLSLFAQPIQADLGLSDTALGLLFGLVFIVPLALVTLIVGWAIDRYDRVRIILFGVVLWSLATAACGLATDFGTLALARGLMGAGEATIGPAGYALIADRFAPGRRGRAIGAVAAAVSVGTGAALVVGGLLLRWLGDGPFQLPLIGESRSWQVAYLMLGALGVPATLLVLTLRDPRRGRPAVAAGGGSWRFLAANRLLFAAVLLCAALNVAAGTAVVSWSPTLLIRRFALAPDQAGYILGMMSILGGLTGPPLASALSDRWMIAGATGGRLRGHPVLFGLIILGVVLLSLAPDLILASCGLFFVAFALGALNAVSYAAIPDITPKRAVGRTLAITQFVSLACGYGLGPSIVALLTDKVFGDGRAIASALIAAVVPLAVAGILLALAARHDYHGATEDAVEP